MLTTTVIVRIVMMMIALFAVFVRMRVMMVMMRPGWEWVGKVPPVLGTLAHLVVTQQAGIDRRLQSLPIDIERHDAEGLSSIAERLPPLLSSVLGHFSFPAVSIACRPPGSRGRTVKIRSREIETTYFVHARSQPEKSFRAKDGLGLLSNEVRKALGMKGTPGGITDCSYSAVGRWLLIAFEQASPTGTGQ